MLNKMLAATAVLALGLGLGTWQAQASQVPAGTSAATVDTGAPARVQTHAVLPYEGSYLGHDMHYRTVRFDYYGGKIHNFRVNHTTAFPKATVSGHQFHHTCLANLCIRGQWTDDVTVEGIWNDTKGGEAHFTAALFAHSSMAAPASRSTVHAVLPYEGSYLGHDMYGRTVRFTFRGNQMSHFTVNSTSFGGAHVSGHAWHETCSNGRCTRGMWTDDVTVEGQWRDPNGHVAHWTARLFMH